MPHKGGCHCAAAINVRCLVLLSGAGQHGPQAGKLDPARVTVIGDARAPGRTREAIESVYKAAFFGSTS